MYYIAPRFTTWDKYMLMFQAEDLLAQSLLVSPSEIDAKLESQGEPDGRHHIVYDQGNVFVCSEPIRLEETKGLDMAVAVRGKVEQRKQRTEDALKDVYDGLGSRRDIRGRPRDQGHDARTITPDLFPELGDSPSKVRPGSGREICRGRVETWAIGAQLFAVTLDG